jgi:hypothetical protein
MVSLGAQHAPRFRLNAFGGARTFAGGALAGSAIFGHGDGTGGRSARAAALGAGLRVGAALNLGSHVAFVTTLDGGYLFGGVDLGASDPGTSAVRSVLRIHGVYAGAAVGLSIR